MNYRILAIAAGLATLSTSALAYGGHDAASLRQFNDFNLACEDYSHHHVDLSVYPSQGKVAWRSNGADQSADIVDALISQNYGAQDEYGHPLPMDKAPKFISWIQWTPAEDGKPGADQVYWMNGPHVSIRSWHGDCIEGSVSVPANATAVPPPKEVGLCKRHRLEAIHDAQAYAHCYQEIYNWLKQYGKNQIIQFHKESGTRAIDGAGWQNTFDSAIYWVGAVGPIGSTDKVDYTTICWAADTAKERRCVSSFGVTWMSDLSSNPQGALLSNGIPAPAGTMYGSITSVSDGDWSHRKGSDTQLWSN